MATHVDLARQVLDSATHGNHVLLAEILETSGKMVMVSDEEGCTALQHAAANGHDQAVLVLLKHNAAVNSRSAYGWTALMQAAAFGHMSVVTHLVKAGADVNMLNEMSATALHCAARGGHSSVVHLLLAEGARVDDPRFTGSPLLTAAQNGHESVVRLLLDKGADVNASTATGFAALTFAALNGFLHVVQVLVAHGADTNAVTAGDLTAHDIASQSGNTAVEQFLSKRTQARKGGPTRHLRLDVFEAAKRGDFQQVKYLLEVEKVDVNKKDVDGATCLMFAAMRGHLEVAELLVDSGAEIDDQDDISGWTALMQATYYGHNAIARLLIDAGAKVSVQANNGCTAFDIASIIGDTEVVRLLAAVSMGAPLQRSRGVPRARLGPGHAYSSEEAEEGEEVASTLRPSRRRSGSVTIRPPNMGPVSLDAGGGGPSATKGTSAQVSQVPQGAGPLDFGGTASSTGKRAWWRKVADRFRRLRSTRFSLISTFGSSARQRDLTGDGGEQNMGAPISKLPANILAPIKPPFMPPPAFELTHMGSGPSRRFPVERPKFQQRASGSATRVGSAGSAVQDEIPTIGSRKGSFSSLSSFKRLRQRRLKNGVARQRSDSTSSAAYSSSHEDTSAVEEQDDLTALLGKHGLYRLIPVFTEQEVDMDAFLTLTAEDLAELGLHDAKDAGKVLALIQRTNAARSGTTNGLDEAVSQFRRGQHSLPLPAMPSTAWGSSGGKPPSQPSSPRAGSGSKLPKRGSPRSGRVIPTPTMMPPTGSPRTVHARLVTPTIRNASPSRAGSPARGTVTRVPSAEDAASPTRQLQRTNSQTRASLAAFPPRKS